MPNHCVLIPTFNPSNSLLELINQLLSLGETQIILVDDGSDALHKAVLNKIENQHKITILHHDHNMGKGAALKDGMKYAYENFPDIVGVVTADGDGQHTPADIIAIGKTLEKEKNKLIIGTRCFDRKVPLRSRIGNLLTRNIFKAVVGLKVNDTQSGLRGIPRDFIPRLLEIKSVGYEFELDMLLTSKYSGKQIVEQKIETIYIENNKDSHFNPIIDSLKIYFELFRSSLISLATSIIDNIVFFIALYFLGMGILSSQIIARVIAVFFNYPMAKKYVFISEGNNLLMFMKFILLVIISGAVSYGIIRMLVFYLDSNAMIAKISAEVIIYFVNFCIQRDYIFSKHSAK